MSVLEVMTGSEQRMAVLPNTAAGVAVLFAMIRMLVGDSPATADAPISATKHAAAPRENRTAGARASRPSVPRFALHFTAPADAPRTDSSGRARDRSDAVHGYEFLQVDQLGMMTVLGGYADSVGDQILIPHEPGTQETVWLEPAAPELAKTIFVLSHGWSGHSSSWSNGVGIAAVLHGNTVKTARPARISLPVPVVAHAPRRSGEAALELVMRYYGADSGSLQAAFRGQARDSTILGLAAAARRAGYAASILTLTPESLISLVASHVPPIVAYRNRPDSLAEVHFGVVTGWDSARETFTLHDGGAQVQVVDRSDLAQRWRTAGSQALVVRR